MSLFGNSTFGSSTTTAQNPNNLQVPQQQPAPNGLFGGSTSLFGSTNNSAAPNNTTNTTTPGAGLFGGSTTGGGLFGSTNTNTNQQQQPATGGLFGNTQQQGQQPAGGGLFGNTGAAPGTGTAGGLFGNTSTQQPQPAAGGGLFGSTNTNTGTNTGAGLFGNTATNTQQPAGGLFGSTNTSTTQPAAGGLFGNTGASTSGTGTTGGLFGATNTTNTGTTGGLFGNTSTNQPAAGGGLFGNTANQQQAAGGGLFGSTSTNQQPATGGGLFGTTQPSTGGLFGSTINTSTNNLFGSTTTQNQPNKTFGFGSTTPGQPQQPQQGGLFGTSTLGVSALGSIGARGSVTPQQQPDPQRQFAALQQRIEEIVNAWNASSPQCRFQHYFYNLVDPNQVHLYGRPPNATNDSLWQKAVRENPDPSCLVPVVANGFDDLQQRAEGQTKQAQEHHERLKELKTKIEALQQRHQISNISRIKRAAALQTQLTQRVLKLVQHLHLLIPALRSSSIRPEEEALRVALEDIDEEVRRPGGIGKMRAKLNELWALVGALSAAREQDAKEGGMGWAVVDEDGLERIAQVLADEQAGLAHVTKVLRRGLKDLAVIQGVPVKEEDEPDLFSSMRS